MKQNKFSETMLSCFLPYRNNRITKFFYVVIFFFVFFSNITTAIAKHISIEDAKTVAYKWYKFKSNFKIDNISIDNESVYKYKGTDVFYIFTFSNSGFVLVAADDAIKPILGYSTENNFDINNIPSNVKGWLDNYGKEIEFILNSNISNETTLQQWNDIRNENFLRSTSSVNPLCPTKWGQICYYNAYCPAGSEVGLCNHVYAGSTAVAMAQIMKHWSYPVVGTGSHSYVDPTYGTLSANFGSTTYNWVLMPIQITSSNPAIATLIYHCGVSINTQYSDFGSYANMADVPGALINYFNYKNTSEIKYKFNYSNPDWIQLLKNELDLGRPVLYEGTDPAMGNHAFICDGYQGTDNFHINWGWSGADDGYYTIGNLNAGGCQFNQDNSAIIGILPLSCAVDIISNPVSQVVCMGLSSFFNITASSQLQVDYKWFHNDVEITNSNNDTLFLANVSLADTGYYYCIASNVNDKDTSTIVHLTIQVPFQNEQICLVTVDTVTWKNKVMWEKTPNVGTESYNIYHETGVNIYALLGNVPYNSQSYFIDYSSIPESHGDKYKITVVDTCGNESVKSPYHKTMNLTIAAFGSTMGLNWDAYIDSSGNFIPIRYYIYRGTQPDNMQLLDSISASFTSYNDNNIFNVYYYIIGVKKDPPCDINGIDMAFSNKKDNSTLVGIVEHNGFNSEALSINPNPFKESTTIKFFNPDNKTFLIILTDSKGRVVREAGNVSGSEIHIEKEDLKAGDYFIELKSETRTYRGKIMIE